MQKILLLGKNGMLGSVIAENCELRIANCEFISWNRQDLDITDKKQVIKKISEIAPDIVINATGWTDVDGAELDRHTAFKVNADGVGYIAKACNQIGASLIHFSTDYVFDGTQSFGYAEDDVEHLKPVNVYGKSKLEGELQVTSYKLQKYFIIRTSWLYGAGGKNFVDTMLKKARDGQDQFTVVNDQFGLPTYTCDLAERVLWMVEKIDQLESGVYHITNSKCKIKNCSQEPAPAGISWFEFALEIFKQAKELGILSKLPNVTPCASDQFSRPAKRPKYGVLINTKLPEMREWRKSLYDYLMSNIK